MSLVDEREVARYVELANKATDDELQRIPQEIVNACYLIDPEHKPFFRRILRMALSELGAANEALAACRAEAGGRIRQLEADLAEAKRDTERLDWLEEAVPSGRLRQAAEDMTTCSGTVRSLIDGLRRMPPTPETKDGS